MDSNCKQLNAISTMMYSDIMIHSYYCTGWRRINQTVYFCCPSSIFVQQNTCRTKNISQSGAQYTSSTGCNNERQSFVKLPYSAIDNVLTNLLPAGLQNFFQVLNISNAMMTVNKLLVCPQMEWSSGFKSGLVSGQLMFRHLLTFSYLHILCQ